MMRDVTAAADYVFDLDGGRPCLDFANTRTFSGSDHLTSYADLIAFAEQSSLITPADADWLRAEAQRDAPTAAAALSRARRLRDTLRSLFGALAAGATPSDDDLQVLNADLAASLSHARLVPLTEEGAYGWGWTNLQLTSPIWPITRSAAEVLTSDDERRLLRQCGAEDCEWLFMDTSKNRSRQWCSMKSCGNREKARRHYERQRALRRRTA